MASSSSGPSASSSTKPDADASKVLDWDMASGKGPDNLKRPVELVRCDLRNSVCLDTVGDRAVVTNMVTYEQTRLPAGQFTLVFSSDGYFCTIVGVLDNGEDFSEDLDARLRQGLWQGPDGDIYLEDRQHEYGDRAIKLDDMRSRHRLASVHFAVGSTSAPFSVNLAIMVTSRGCGMRIFWSMDDVYKVLGITAWAYSSRWVSRSSERWLAQMTGYCGLDTDMLVFSATMLSAEHSSKRKVLPFHQRCLPHNGASTFCLMVLLARWCGLVPQAGGLQVATCKSSARQLLTTFVTLALESDPECSVEVVACPEWSCRWPRPAAEPDEVVLKLDIVDGDIVIKGLREAVNFGGIVQLWSKAVSKAFGTEVDTVDVIEFVFGIIAMKQLTPLVAQLLWFLSLKFEKFVGSISQMKKRKAGGLLKSFAWVGISTEAGRRQDLFVAKYVFAAQQALAAERVFFMSTDKAQVCRLPLQNTCIGGKRNLVQRGFDSEPGTSKKRTAEEALEESDQLRKKRQVDFLQRHQGGTFGAWRLRKVHRVKAKQWCMALDSQFRSCSGRAGLIFFRPDSDSDLWSDPFRFPHASIAMDLGSDGNAGYWALERFFGLNIDQFNDQSHGACCDWDLMLKAVGAKSMFILMVVSWNTPHGPRKGDDLRLHEMRDCLRELYDGSGPNNTPLFADYRARIEKALVQLGVQLPGVDSPEAEIWRWLRSRALFGRSGRRVSMCRFLSSVAACAEHTPAWPVDEFERTYCCLETGVLASKKLTPLILRGEAAASTEVGEKAGPTAASRPTVDDAAIRSCAQNAMVISQLVLGDHTNERFCKILCLTGRELMSWHGEQNRETRAAEQSHQWFYNQVCGKYQEHLAGLLKLLSSAQALQSADFAVTGAQVQAVKEDMIAEDDFADFFGQSVVGLVCFRMRRNLGMLVSWPKRLVLILQGGEVADKIISQFKRDYESWRAMNDMAVQTPAMKNFLRRSSFNKVSVTQMVECFRLTNWRRDERIDQLIRDHYTGLMQTQIIEDVIGHQKNNPQSQAHLRFRRPVASMCSALSANVLTERRKFRTVAADYAAKSKSSRLPADSFYAPRAKQSLKFQLIATLTAEAPYYSPAAEHNQTPAADLALQREFARTESAEVFEHAGMSLVSDFRHRLAIQEVDEADPDAFLFCLGCFPHSGALVWPCRRVHVLGGAAPTSFLQFDMSATEPTIIAMYNLRNYRACTTIWRSWAWQQVTFGHRMKEFPPAVRPVFEGEPKGLFEVCCEAAFWNLSKSVIESLATNAGIDFGTPTSLCGTLEAVISGGLGRPKQYETNQSDMGCFVCSGMPRINALRHYVQQAKQVCDIGGKLCRYAHGQGFFFAKPFGSGLRRAPSLGMGVIKWAKACHQSASKASWQTAALARSGLGEAVPPPFHMSRYSS